MIVTLAGHVDHGKTSLVNALTGVNTDRLAEEKARGLTIDLGFAYIDDGDIGFVDVPGHQKFIHNMVAGVAADQYALLVIAADDGPMPQSKEHLDILKLVGVSRGTIALTKCDRVDENRIKSVEEQIRNLVAGTFLESADIHQTAIDNSQSVEALLNTLRSNRHDDKEQPDKAFRIAIDRSFSIKGAGVVVTGTAHEGKLDVGDELHHMPSGRTLRVRGLRVQNEIATSARRGNRCAINVTGMELDEIGRGDWLSTAVMPRHHELTVEMQVLPDFPRAIRQWTPVHVYHATSHVTGHIALHAGSRIAPGGEKLVDIVCDEPLSLRHGDHLVVRDHGLDTTLGGGKVVFANEAISTRRRNPDRLKMLNAYSSNDANSCLQRLLEDGVCDLRAFRSLWQLTEDDTTNLVSAHNAMTMADFAISRSQLGEYAKTIVARISEHVEAHPSSRGLKIDAFKNIPNAVLEQVLQALVQANRIQVVNGVYGPAGRSAELPEGLKAIWQRAEGALDSTQPPSAGDLAKIWGDSQQDMQRALRELAKRGLLVQVADHRFYLPQVIDQIAVQVAEMAGKAPFPVREFRDATGIGRNVAIDILEYFDRKGFTRREDNHRKLLREKL